MHKWDIKKKDLKMLFEIDAFTEAPQNCKN